MSNYKHPIGSTYDARRGIPNADTVFVDLTCKNQSALVRRNEHGETTADIKEGHFKTTIWEYQTALRLGLISDVQINYCVDCAERTDFSKFVNPIYESRRLNKLILAPLKDGDTGYDDAKKTDIFYKLLLNNAYGRFAINPRRFCDYFLTDPDARPDNEWMDSLWEIKNVEERKEAQLPVFRGEHHAIWKRPAPRWYFQNVGTAASITGAARSILMEAIEFADTPIYCDTDSLICKGFDAAIKIHPDQLGAWKCERELSEILIAGKKTYATKDRQSGEVRVRSKGTSGVTWADILEILAGQSKEFVAKAPTLYRTGAQTYMRRTLRMTAERLENVETGISHRQRTRAASRAGA